MAYTLAYLRDSVPKVPAPGEDATLARPDVNEHFGSEDSALDRAAGLFAAGGIARMRLYGPDGHLIADAEALLDRLGAPHRGDD